MCLVAMCNRDVYAHRFCKRHYYTFNYNKNKNKTIEEDSYFMHIGVYKRVAHITAVCKNEGCDRTVFIIKSGRCHRCYQCLQRTGKEWIYKPHNAKCITGCNRHAGSTRTVRLDHKTQTVRLCHLHTDRVKLRGIDNWKCDYCINIPQDGFRRCIACT